MRIGIALDDVLRDFSGQLTYVYNKYIGTKKPQLVFNENGMDVVDKDGNKLFENKEMQNSFLYRDASLEIFGHADQMEDNLFTKFNKFLMDIKDDEEHEIIIVSREYNMSIPSTLFFLSKVLCKCDNLKFVENYEDKWDYVDVLVTANPIALENKPEGKTSVKVLTPYNVETEADYEIESIFEFIESDTLRDLILS